MPFPKKKLFVQSHSVDLCTENRVLFFEENWNFKVKAVYLRHYSCNLPDLNVVYIQYALPANFTFTCKRSLFFKPVLESIQLPGMS